MHRHPLSSLLFVPFVLSCGGLVREPTQSPDFSVSCALDAGSGAVCASATCTVQTTGGLTETLDVSVASVANVSALGVPSTVSATAVASSFTIDFVAGGTVDTDYVVTFTDSSGRRHAAAISLAMSGSVALPTAGTSMVLYGCPVADPAGEGPVATFVGTWEEGYRELNCDQVLSNVDGSYALAVPKTCFAPGAPVYITVGGEIGCTRPFTPGATARVDLGDTSAYRCTP